MVMPIYDDAPLRYLRRPIVNWTLIALNIIVFLVVQSELFGDPLTVVRGFAIIPRVLFGEAELADWIVGPPAAATLVTALFFHSSLVHLGSNMLFLYVFGDNVEDAMGSLHYLLFYLSCGVASGVFYIYATPHSITPLIGASGAISGVCAAFLLLHPRATVAGIFPPLSLGACADLAWSLALGDALEVDSGAAGAAVLLRRLRLALRRRLDFDAAYQRLYGRGRRGRLDGACRRDRRRPGADAAVQAPPAQAFRPRRFARLGAGTAGRGRGRAMIACVALSLV